MYSEQGSWKSALRSPVCSWPLKAREWVLKPAALWVHWSPWVLPLAAVRGTYGGIPAVRQNSPAPRAGGCLQRTNPRDCLVCSYKRGAIVMLANYFGEMGVYAFLHY